MSEFHFCELVVTNFDASGGEYRVAREQQVISALSDLMDSDLMDSGASEEPE